MSDGGFYRAFEDQHRGSRELIHSRLAVYLPFVRSVAQLHPGAPVTDVGCGRGEWLELLRSEGIAGQGVDLDEGMLESCRALGLDVHKGDALAFLRGLAAGSQAIVSGFHIAEHLPFELLHELVRQAHRVLKPGGLLILETPNPENLLVATSGFYLDPTHQRPIPWQLLEFMMRHHGFAQARLLRLQEPAELLHRDVLSLLDVLGGASPDYAMVGQKPPLAEHTAQLQPPFEKDHGLALDVLADRYDRRLKDDIHLASVTALRAEQGALAAQDYEVKAERVFHELQVRLANNETRIEAQAQAQFEAARIAAHTAWLASVEYAKAQARAEAMHQQLLALYNSSSWRLTRPVRLAGRFARWIVGPAHVALVAGLARKLGIHAPLRALYRKLRPRAMPPAGAAYPPEADMPGTPGASSAGAMPDAAPLSPDERRIAEQLESVSRRGPEKPY